MKASVPDNASLEKSSVNLLITTLDFKEAALRAKRTLAQDRLADAVVKLATIIPRSARLERPSFLKLIETAWREANRDKPVLEADLKDEFVKSMTEIFDQRFRDGPLTDGRRGGGRYGSEGPGYTGR
jgi:hypothetical protein